MEIQQLGGDVSTDQNGLRSESPALGVSGNKPLTNGDTSTASIISDESIPLNKIGESDMVQPSEPISLSGETTENGAALQSELAAVDAKVCFVV